MGITIKNKDNEREFPFTDGDFNFIKDLIFDHAGIVLSDIKRNLVYSRISKRIRHHNMSAFKEYCDFITTKSGQDELQECFNSLTTNLTSFFREGHHFEHLRDALIKHVDDTSSNKKIRIWSSACSSGPEPYSISMVLDEVLKSSKRLFDAKILATDIDSNMVETAYQGTYSNKIYDEIPQMYRSKYLDKKHSRNNGKDLIMPDKLKAYITFKSLNLLKKWPMRGLFDVIFCRNVVIYFNKETQAQLFDHMADVLQTGGLLYIGHSETLHGVSDRFELIGRTTYRKIK